jgi:hypothetical protein
MRVCVHTGNPEASWHAPQLDGGTMTQGVFTQDFPLKDAASPRSSPFENDLLEYIDALALPLPLWAQARARVAAHNFSAARARLVASAPGAGNANAHHGAALNSWGINKLRAALEAEPGVFPPRFAGAPLAAQYSSVGATSLAWVGQFVADASAGRAAGTGGLALGPPAGAGAAPGAGLALVWPAVEEVRACGAAPMGVLKTNSHSHARLCRAGARLPPRLELGRHHARVRRQRLARAPAPAVPVSSALSVSLRR